MTSDTAPDDHPERGRQGPAFAGLKAIDAARRAVDVETTQH